MRLYRITPLWSSRSRSTVLKVAVILLALCAALTSRSSDTLRSRLEVGLCIKKMAGFYWSNGFSADYSSPALVNSRLHLGIHLTSSSLGSAISSNALPLHMAELYAHYFFRPGRYLQPFVAWNIGFATVNYGSGLYKDLPGSQMLLSPEGGLSYLFTFPLRATASLGYNVITGNGSKGLGVVYPLFFQVRLLYRIR